MRKPLRQERVIKSSIVAKMVDHSCTRKKLYSNKNIARNKAADTSKRLGEVLEYYKCRWGSHYHIGHPRKDAKQNG